MNWLRYIVWVEDNKNVWSIYTNVKSWREAVIWREEAMGAGNPNVIITEYCIIEQTRLPWDEAPKEKKATC